MINLYRRTSTVVKRMYHQHHYAQLESQIIQQQRTKEFIIDARSPCEYKIDHKIGAINVPVLNDQERDHVGKKHRNDSFQARLIGAGLISKNIGDWLVKNQQTLTKDQPYLVYCARGGQRSQSLAHILQKIGFTVQTLPRGYRDYRAQVLNLPHELKQYQKIALVAGPTGVGKGLLLNELRNMGEQVLDFEWAAKHYGSILGAWPNVERPSHRMFESHLFWQLCTFCPDPTKPVFVESESGRIGEFAVPMSFTSKPNLVFRVHASLEERIKYTRRLYDHWEQPQSRQQLVNAVNKILESNVGNAKIASLENREKLLQFIEQQDFESLVRYLIQHHYDKKYDRKRDTNVPVIDIGADKIEPKEYKQLATNMSKTVHSLLT
jgi:tRNA 2-selenouridine synthase